MAPAICAMSAIWFIIISCSIIGFAIPIPLCAAAAAAIMFMSIGDIPFTPIGIPFIPTGPFMPICPFTFIGGPFMPMPPGKPSPAPPPVMLSIRACMSSFA